MSKSYMKYLLKRVFFMFLTLLIIITVTFVLLNFLPGTPYTNQDRLTPEQIQIMNERYGLNDPMIVQYFRYLGNVLTGDLGVSFQFANTPVTQLITDRMGPSFIIGGQGLVLGTILGVLLGVFAAMYRNTWIDNTATFLAIIGRSIPNFVIAVLLQQIFAVDLGWFPIALWGTYAHTVLPSISLAVQPMADTSRFVRTEMVDVLNSDYIELARAKGLSKNKVAFKHGLRNALIPLVTILGPLAAATLTGSMVIENIFAIPGIGELFVQSILTNDYPTIMGVTIFYSFVLILALLIVDILYGIIDPRIRVTGEGDN